MSDIAPIDVETAAREVADRRQEQAAPSAPATDQERGVSMREAAAAAPRDASDIDAEKSITQIVDRSGRDELKPRDSARELAEYRLQKRQLLSELENAPQDINADDQAARPPEAPPLPQAAAQEADDIDAALEHFNVADPQARDNAKAVLRAAVEARSAKATQEHVAKVQTEYGSSLREFTNIVGASLLAEFGNIVPEQLARTDPAAFARMEKMRGVFTQLTAHQQQMQTMQQQEQARRAEEWMGQQDQLAKARIPDLDRLAPQLSPAMRDYGFSDHELSAAFRGAGVNMRDARVQSIVADALRYRAMMASARDIRAKPLPPVQRPGVARDRGAARMAEVESIAKRLDHTGNVKDAAKLVAARRAASRAARRG